MAEKFMVQKRSTKPYEGQKPGTSGLRKPTKTFMQPNYVENFVQACLIVAKKYQKPNTHFRLVLGGDGRYFLKEALLKAIVPICAANDVEEVMIGENGILSTPAVSTIVRRYGTTGAFILTASHNPGGPDGDFGLKYNIENGGPAPETITNEVYKITTTISEYCTLDRPLPIDLCKLGTTDYCLGNGKAFKVTIISSTEDYITYMKEIFDFDLIKNFLNGANGKPPFKVLVDGLNGVTGPYIKALLVDNFGLSESSTLDCTPLPDFGGHHPDPNLTYAAKLVDAVRADKSIGLAAAFDGDGDRNMIIGQGGFFVCPCDSLAVIADNVKSIKYFAKTGVKGFARSMPTSPAVDRVCKVKNIPVFETPTGWKFFGNLLDAEMASVCGEESFGTGSNHIREKDGIWAFLCWVSILASRQAEGKSANVRDVLRQHWSKYGRDFFTRYDYENCTEEQGKQVMERVKSLLSDPEFVGRTYTTNRGTCFKVLGIDDFSYTDPVDHSVSKNQGIRIMLNNETRIVYRMSGTGSSGSTIRIYVNTFSADPNTHDLPATESVDTTRQDKIPVPCKKHDPKMADDSTKLSPHLGMRKKRSVQFLVDCHLQEAEGSGGGSIEASGYCSSHEGDNISVRSTGSGHRAVVCPFRSASPRPFSGTVDPAMTDEDEDGSPITISRPPDAPEDLAVFEIGLGMLRQHTIYEVQFLLPSADRLNCDDVEITRTNVVLPVEGKHFERGADVEVIRIDYFKNDGIYKLTLKITTCSMSHLSESFVLRESHHHENCVYFMLRGNALGKGHGTPSLRLGIHQVGHTAEYEGSDGKTEWTGFADEDEGGE